MDKAITTSLFIAIGIIMSLMLFNVTYPATVEGTNAIAGMSDRIEQRMRSQVKIIHTSGELDAAGNWNDVNGNGLFEVSIWVKNVGETRIFPLESLDIFFGPEGNFSRIPYEGNAAGAYPRWTGMVENGNEWVPSGTLRIVVQYSSPMPSGRYYLKISLPNGVTDSYFLGI